DLHVGDLIVEVNGQPVGDPVSLSQRLTAKSDESGAVNLTVETKDRQGHPVRRSISVMAHPPLQSPTQMLINPTSIESIGAAVEVTCEVAAVSADGPAGNIGIVPGDVVTEVQLVCDDEQSAKALSRFTGSTIMRPMELKPGKKSWPEVIYLLQMILQDTNVNL